MYVKYVHTCRKKIFWITFFRDHFFTRDINWVGVACVLKSSRNLKINFKYIRHLRCWRPIAKTYHTNETPFGSVDPFAMINCCAPCKWIICSTNRGLPESVSAPPLNILMISKQVMRSSRLWHDQNEPLSRSWLKSNGITCQLTLSCHLFIYIFEFI